MQPVYFKDGQLYLLDQTRLPAEEVTCSFSDYRQAIKALKDMVVRGAPAIGITGAYSVVLAAQELQNETGEVFYSQLLKAMNEIGEARPTAVNLMWAVDRMKKALMRNKSRAPKMIVQALKQEADLIRDEDEQMCRTIGANGAALFENRVNILTHCNAGALATADYGTALGVIRALQEAGKEVHVYADETRPLLQGARLTAYELEKDSIPVTLITDNMAAWMMHNGKIDAIVVGADRIAANGDTANKIGTYGLSILAQFHQIPMYIAAPSSTIDFNLSTGDEIIIEERDPDEVRGFNGISVAPDNVDVENPAFDVTPNELITAIITDKGVLYPPFTDSLITLKESN